MIKIAIAGNYSFPIKYVEEHFGINIINHADKYDWFEDTSEILDTTHEGVQDHERVVIDAIFDGRKQAEVHESVEVEWHYIPFTYISTDETVRILVENNIDVYMASWTYNGLTHKAINENVDNFICIMGAGNSSINGESKQLVNENIIAIGAVDGFSYDEESFDLAYYSGRGKGYVDFVDLGHQYYYVGDKRYQTKGTSFAGPKYLGKIILLLEKYKNRYKNKMTAEKVIEFTSKHVIDFWEEGKDYKYGYGMYMPPQIYNFEMFGGTMPMKTYEMKANEYAYYENGKMIIINWINGKTVNELDADVALINCSNSPQYTLKENEEAFLHDGKIYIHDMIQLKVLKELPYDTIIKHLKE